MPVVNFTNVIFYRHLLRKYSFAKKLQIKTVCREMLHKVLLYEKAAHKMLLKLTPAVNFINILHAQNFGAKKLQSGT